MRSSPTLSRQLALEISGLTTLGFLAILVIALGQNLLNRMDSILMLGLTAGELLDFTRCLLPVLASYSLPIAFLFGALIALRRMGADGEMLAMQSLGLGLEVVLVPTLAIGLALSLLSAHLVLSVEHRARREMMGIFKSAASRGGVIEPGQFKLLGERMIFVQSRDHENRLEGVMIDDQSDFDRRFRIFAERGQLGFAEDRDEVFFELENGDIHFEPEPGAPRLHRRLSFERLHYRVDVAELMGAAMVPVRPRQMNLAELRGVLVRAETDRDLFGLDQREPVAYALEIERRVAMPLAPVLFAVLAVGMGMGATRSGRSWSVLQCAAIVFAYYALFTEGQSFAQRGWMSPRTATWLPNVALALLGAALLWRFSRGRPLARGPSQRARTR